MQSLPRPPAKTLSFERSIEIDCPVEVLYAFHRDTRNAPKVSPGTRFLSIDGDFPLDDGDVFTIRFVQRPLPMTLTWRFVVEAVVLNRAVIDVALQSPFAYWRHEHRFESLGPRRARLTDRVTYAPPFGPLGRAGAALLGRAMMERLFAERHQRTKVLLEGTR